MTRVLSVLTAVAFSTGLLTTALSAQAFRKHTDAKNGFTIEVPQDWKVGTPTGVALEAASQDDLANFRVVVQARNNMSASQILESMEQQLGYENMLDPPQRKLNAQALKPTGAQDCTVGAYSVTRNNVEINQRIWVYVKGQKAYIIVETVPDENLGDMIDIFDRMSKSIRIK